MRRIDFYTLRLFVSVAREGSIARAAGKEHIAPSALSRRIADLERAFAVPLVVRSPRGIELTEAGRTVFEQGTKIDHDLDALVRDVQTRSGLICGTVRLWANTSSLVGFLPERLKAFCASYPKVEIELQQRTTSEVIRACLDDLADVGVGMGAPLRGGLDSWLMGADPVVVILPVGHKLVRRRPLKFADVLDHNMVRIQAGGALDQLIHERATALRRGVRIGVTVNTFDTACRMVEVGFGLALVPNGAASAFASRRFLCRALDEPWAQREIYVYALRKQPRARAVSALIEALKGRSRSAA